MIVENITMETYPNTNASKESFNGKLDKRKRLG